MPLTYYLGPCFSPQANEQDYFYNSFLTSNFITWRNNYPALSKIMQESNVFVYALPFTNAKIYCPIDSFQIIIRQNLSASVFFFTLLLIIYASSNRLSITFTLSVNPKPDRSLRSVCSLGSVKKDNEQTLTHEVYCFCVLPIWLYLIFPVNSLRILQE